VKGKKGFFGIESLAGWILAIAGLVILLILSFILSDKGDGALNYIKNLLRFGR